MTTPPQRWLLLRGLGREQRHWGDFPARLQQARPQDQLLCLDLPGNGRQWRQPSPLSIAAMTEHCRRQLPPAASPGAPLRLLCLSMGAMVAVDWARRYPQELHSAVLISTSLRGLSAWHQRMRPLAGLRLLGALATPGLRWREAEVLRLSSRRAPADAALLAQWCALQQAQPVSRLNLLRQLLAAARFRAPAQPPALPLLLLAGAGDRMVAPACSQRIAAAWHCPLVLHPWAGHDLPLDDPDWVIARILAWAESAN